MPATNHAGNADERRPLLSSSHSPSSHGAVTQASTSDVSGDDEDRSFSCRQCLSNYVPIELLLFGYAFSRIVVVVLTGFFYFDQASHMYGDPSMSSLNPCGHNRSADHGRADEVQKEALQLTMIGAFSVYMTAVIPTLFIGPLIDLSGRRLGFVLPLLGTVLRAIVFLFVLGTGASVYYVYIGTVLEGLGGGFGSFLMTSFSAAADVSKPGRQRALRLCIVEAVNVLGSALAQFIAGQWRRQSYTQPVMLAAALGVLTLIYALWGMPETLESPLERGAPSCNQQTNPRAITQQSLEGEQSGERQPLLSAGKISAVPPQAGSGQEASPFRSGGGGGGLGGQGGMVERVGINRGGPGSDEEEFRRVAGFEGGVAAEGTPSNQHEYTSFSPTGHRLSNPAAFHNSQRGHSRELHPDFPGEDTLPKTSPTPSAPPQNRPVPDGDKASCCSYALPNIRRSWDVYRRKDDTSHPHRRSVLFLCFVCFLLTVAVNFSKPGVETVFRLGELCWDAVQESEFDSGWLVQHWVFILVVMHVLQRWLKARDVTVAIVGCVSALCAPLIFSFATLPHISETTANVLVFISAGSGTLARVLIPMLRSMSSAVVSLDEQGALFAVYACVELAGAAVFDMVASQIYKATIHLWKGIIFAVMAAFFVVVLILLIILSVLQRRWRRMNPDTAEAPSQTSQG